MTDQQRASDTMKQEVKSPFGARIGIDPEINTTVISLTYTDKDDATHSMEVGITPELGSNLFRFRVGALDLIYYESELLKQKQFIGNFVLWPLPNRVRDKHYSYQGKNYSLQDVKRVETDKALVHGLVLDQIWQYEQPIIKADSVSVTTYIEQTPESPHFAAYPFRSRLSLTYTLTHQGIDITYKVENKDTHDLPFGFALHPYFPILDGAQETYVTLPTDAVMEADDALLPTGRIFEVGKLMYAMYDLRQGRPVSCLNLDHVYTQIHSGEAAIIDYKKRGLQLRITASDDFTHIVIYAPPGASYLCVEHQTCSTDAINLHNQGERERQMAHLLEVAPGQSYSGTLHYTPTFS
ncbi:aldose 1-epimerase [Ktedonobacter robiniae]|uniref:Aldose 1-epimerase n=1 Tax=Ktedonobacter robiniae TaxID=2778365 RepID=A0ABQ3USA8_9CHLR|nr:aldose 1-epimerase [Ktedonobacter robiniae]GHO55582.1 aldose 1-epimerase [Ktedonobacter robiniae]